MAPDLIIGVAGGGVIPAGIIARALKCYNIEFIGLRSYNENCSQDSHLQMYRIPNLTTQSRSQQVLVIDDILDTGNTFKFVDEYLRDKNFKNIQYAALHHKLKPLQYVPDNLVYGTQCESESWIEYPWEINTKE